LSLVARLELGSYCDPRILGADGSEINDTATINHMATSGINLYVPTFTFKVTPNVVQPISGWSVQGSGVRAKIESQGFGDLFLFENKFYVSFKDVHLTVKDLVPTSEQGSRTTSINALFCNSFSITDCFISKNLGDQLYLRSCRGFTVANNLLFEGGVTLPAADTAARLYYPASGADINFYGDSVAQPGQYGKSTITGNKCFSNKDIGISVNTLGGDGRLVISNNIVSTQGSGFVDWNDEATLNRRHGISIGYNGPQGEEVKEGNGIIVTGNVISNTLWAGVYQQDGRLDVPKRGLVITSNHIFRVGRAGSYYGNLLGAIFLINPANGTVISGNVIEEFLGTSNADASIKIVGSLTQESEVLITGNIINGSESYGIILGSSNVNALITNNVIKNTALECIRVIGVGTNVDIRSNKIEVNNDTLAINVTDGTNRTLITDNAIKYNSGVPSTKAAVYVRRLGTPNFNCDISRNYFEGGFFSCISSGTYLGGGSNHFPITDNTFVDCLSAFDNLLFTQRCFVFGSTYVNTPKSTNAVLAVRMFDAAKIGVNVKFTCDKADITSWNNTRWVASIGDNVNYGDTISAGSVGAVFDSTVWVEY
jgi:hypothetical protein